MRQWGKKETWYGAKYFKCRDLRLSICQQKLANTPIENLSRIPIHFLEVNYEKKQ